MHAARRETTRCRVLAPSARTGPGDGSPVGRWYVHRRADTLHVMDIALLPEFQRQGIGTALIGALMHEAMDSTRRITLYVEIFNTALRWYERLGFRPIDEEGVNLLMEWKAL